MVITQCKVPISTTHLPKLNVPPPHPQTSSFNHSPKYIIWNTYFSAKQNWVGIFGLLQFFQHSQQGWFHASYLHLVTQISCEEPRGL